MPTLPLLRKYQKQAQAWGALQRCLLADGHVERQVRPLSIRLQMETFGRQGAGRTAGCLPEGSQRTAVKKCQCAGGVNGLFGGPPAE
jgi:hypothetical protein